MLNYTSADEMTKHIAIFYAKKVNSPLAEAFFSGNRSLTSSAEALEVAKAFWAMTSLAGEDHLADKEVLGGVDIEFWMHKLFNKVSGYYEKNGFKEEWSAAESP